MPTYGPSGQPSSMTMNFDALFSTSLANYWKTLVDNISKASPLFNYLKSKGMFKSQDGGLYIAVDLMYGLSPVDFYDGYDELPLTPTEGITQAQFQWRQMAGPASISRIEERKNAQRILNLVNSKIQQLEFAMQEAWPKSFLRGQLFNQSVGDIRLPPTSPVNGSFGFDPLPSLVSYTPTQAASVGGIAQDQNVWWQNFSVTSAATTLTGLLDEILDLYNNCSIGPMGPPDIGLCDQVTWALINKAYRLYFRNTDAQSGEFPFPSIKFFQSNIFWDQYVPNVAGNGGAGNLDTSRATGQGTLYFLNSKTLIPYYDSATNFIETEWQKPINQDARYKHILYMGNVAINNRRKNGVLGAISRNLTNS